MTKDDIIRMAKEAGLRRHQENLMSNPPQIRFFYEGHEEYIEQFANLVAAAEREACAEVAEAWQLGIDDPQYQTDCATAIRARGQMINGMTEQETNETMSVKGLSEPEPEPVDDKELMRRVMALMPEVAVKATEE